MSKPEFNLTVVTPEAILFSGPVTKIVAPGIFQEIAVLPDHTPLYAQLVKGNLYVSPVNRSKQTIPIDGGILRVKRNLASIIVGFG